MRLIKTFTDPDLGLRFSNFLSSKHIQNEFEAAKNSDWGSDLYGTTTYNLWIVDEDQYVESISYLEKFMADPNDPLFISLSEKTTILFSPDNLPPPLMPHTKKTPLTFYILMLCCILFFISETTTPTLNTIPPNIPLYPLLTPKINKSLLYDYPEPFVLIDQVVDDYGVESIENPKLLPLKAQSTLLRARQMPYWKGIYYHILEQIHSPKTISPSQPPPLFEKIQQGEFWRLFTPCLLHSDLLHIFFNMIWLLILGKQIESRLGGFRYLFFIIIAAIVSNTAQYIISGSNFIGFSGVVCAMIAFIWIRQKRAPWEGYQLQRSSIIFILIYILGIMTLQFFSFMLEASYQDSFHVNIANTAHIMGGLLGYLLGRYKNPLTVN